MKTPWSLSTTVRNPERILPFLRVLKEMEWENFDESGQIKFQTLLIQNRLYKPIGLDEQKSNYYETAKDKMSFIEAEEIFKHMKTRSKTLQKSLWLRGRTSVAPLTKMGLAIARKSYGAVHITDLWNAFLDGNLDIGDIYFRFFIKWQLPNPDSSDYKFENGYNIKPFIGVLHLINSVNIKSIKIWEKTKWISKQEFSLFCPSLINFKNIEEYADEIIKLRLEIKGKDRQEQKAIFDAYRLSFAQDFLNTSDTESIGKLLNNLKDYGDNAIRYFRLTRFLYIRGGGFYIDLEPRREIEIENLLNFDNAESIKFNNKEDYLGYIADISEPKLPWESEKEYIRIIIKLIEDIQNYEKELKVLHKENLDYQQLNKEELKKYILQLRQYRRDLQDQENHNKSQGIEQIYEYIEQLGNIFNLDDRPILLEKLSSLGLNALNDALKIKPNYPVGDDNEPTFTAPANTPDIECYYKNFNAICEVTMLNSRDQWYNEWQPVMRHLRDFENKNLDKKAYCLFIAPRIHRDTLNTFWTAVKYEYEGKKQYIIPLTINDFIQLLRILIEIKDNENILTHEEIGHLYDKIINTAESSSNSTNRLSKIPETINSWHENITF